MRTGLRIRLAEPNDRTVLKEIIALSFQRFVRYFAAQSIDSENGRLLVAECDGAVVGFAKLTEFYVTNVEYGCILWLAVHPSHRRKGVASALVEAGTGELKRDGSKAVFASVRRRNKASLATFRRKGFEQVGFVGLWRRFGWRVFQLYGDIWYAPNEVVLMHN